MQFLHKVLSAPQNVEWEGYTPTEMNETMFAKLARDPRKKLLEGSASGVGLYEFPDKIALLDLSNDRLLYLVQWVKKRVFKAATITQIKVWRDKSSPLTKGLAERVFFDYIFPKADCIVTDRMQTSYGRAFWELRIYDAFQRGLAVYTVDQNTQEARRLHTAREFEALKDWWGDEHRYLARKIAICHDKVWD